MSMMKIFFSVGEPSGDIHGANLIAELKRRQPTVDCVGLGGPRMQDAGCELLEDLTQWAVMWFGRVLLNLHRFLWILSRADRYLRHQRPDAVVLIDYPGFNWWIARRARVHGIPVFYYGAPQMWGWAGWRIHKMRRLVDHILCKLPFEESWYRQRGCHATYVGHPFFDEVRRYPMNSTFLEAWKHQPGPLVTILPGSRTQEITQNLPVFLKAATIISDQLPAVRFAIASFNKRQAQLAQDHVTRSGLDIKIIAGRSAELMQLADCCLACSGSVSLELLYHARPTVISYKINRLAYWFQKRFRKVKYITLVNLLLLENLETDDLTPYHPEAPDADQVLFPEYLSWQDRSNEIAGHIVQWLTDHQQRGSLVARLESLRDEVGSGGATARAAQYILNHLTVKPAKTRPHYVPEQPNDTTSNRDLAA